MKFINVPDWLSMFDHLTGWEYIFNVMLNFLVMNILMFLTLAINLLFTVVLCYIILAFYRLMGWKWFDGTTNGFINRS